MVNIFSSAWNSTTNRAISNDPFQVLARRDMCVNEPQNFVLHFEQVRVIGNTPFQSYDIGDIQVTNYLCYALSVWFSCYRKNDLPVYFKL